MTGGAGSRAGAPGTAPGARWLDAAARSYVEATSRALKLHPERAERLAVRAETGARGALRPGRSRRLDVRSRAERIPRPGALVEASARAKLLHVFLHHEVQAAELCAWAIASFPAAPAELREGLWRILEDEARHARMYARRLARLGHRYGDFPVRDWFWVRVPTCRSVRQYTALMGLGFEGGNLEHAERFEGALRDAGDPESADLVARVGREEVAHVHFAGRWFVALGGAADPDSGGPDYDAWRAELPAPITPALLQGRPLARERRRRAGLGEAFLDRLEADGGPGATSRPSEPGTRSKIVSFPGSTDSSGASAKADALCEAANDPQPLTACESIFDCALHRLF